MSDGFQTSKVKQRLIGLLLIGGKKLLSDEQCTQDACRNARV